MASAQSLWKNIASLGALQVFNFALTLSTLPYLTRTLGATAWGQVVFALMIINYLSWIANWGFYLGATRRIAAARADKLTQSHIFITTWMAQWCLTAVLLVVLVVSAYAVPILAANKALYFAGAGMLIGNALTPLWYFNGLEKIRESAILQMAIKALALPLIFTLVNDTDGAVTYLIINSLCSIAVGVFTVFWIFRMQVIKWSYPSSNDVWAAIVQEYRLFTSTLWANLNGMLIPTALGILGSPAELGYYNLADRARGAAITILHPVTHALFPRMCYLFSNEKERALELLKFSGLIMLLLSSGMSVLLLLFSSEIVGALGGHEFLSGGAAMKWLAFSPVFTTMSSFIIYQLLIPSGASRGYDKAMFYTLLVNGALVVPAVSVLGAKGAAITSIFTELFTLVFLVFYVKSQKWLRA